MTTLETLAADAAFALHSRVLALREEVEARFLELARVLVEIRDTRAYEALGCPTLEAYIASPEVALSRRQVFRMLSVADAFLPTPNATDGTAGVSDFDLAEVGITKAALIAPLVKDAEPELVADLMADARTLAVSDLRKRVKERSGGKVLDRDWLEETAQAIIRRAAKLADSGEALRLLDEISSLAMDARARLEGS